MFNPIIQKENWVAQNTRV